MVDFDVHGMLISKQAITIKNTKGTFFGSVFCDKSPIAQWWVLSQEAGHGELGSVPFVIRIVGGGW